MRFEKKMSIGRNEAFLLKLGGGGVVISSIWCNEWNGMEEEMKLINICP